MLPEKLLHISRQPTVGLTNRRRYNNPFGYNNTLLNYFGISPRECSTPSYLGILLCILPVPSKSSYFGLISLPMIYYY